jgi:hypothetical protein
MSYIDRLHENPSAAGLLKEYPNRLAQSKNNLQEFQIQARKWLRMRVSGALASIYISSNLIAGCVFIGHPAGILNGTRTPTCEQ